MVKRKRRIRTSFLSKKEVNKAIIEKKMDLESLERLSKLQKSFNVGKISRLSRKKIKERVEGSKLMTPEAKKKLKIFKFVTSKGVRFAPAVPKGIKVRKK